MVHSVADGNIILPHVCFTNKGRRDKRRKEDHSFAPEMMKMNTSVCSSPCDCHFLVINTILLAASE